MKKLMLVSSVIACLVILFSEVTISAKPKVDYNLGGNLVSSYVWRGMYQSGAAFQPAAGLSVAGFSLGVSGSTDFTGQGHKEFDVLMSYSIAGFTVTVADYWWAGESGIKNPHKKNLNHYFEYRAHETDHLLEAGLSYVLPVEQFPLQVSWSTVFYGADRIFEMDEEGNVIGSRQAYSSYFELSCPFVCGPVTLTPAVGMSPWTSQSCYLNDGFAVTNVSLKAQHDLKITENFALPIFVQAIWNPDRQDVHCVFGISF